MSVLGIPRVNCERGAEVRICRNNRDPGLTLASDNQPGAGQHFQSLPLWKAKKWSTPIQNGRLEMRRFIIEFGVRLSAHL